MMVTESQYVCDKADVTGMRKGGSLDRLSKVRSMTKSDTSRKGSNICQVVIVKVPNKGLGIGIASYGTVGRYDYGIYLKYIAKGSPAAVQGELRLKDVLLSINKEKLGNKSVDEIYRILRNLPPGPVQLLVKRNSLDTDESDGFTDTSRFQSKGKLGKENQRSGIIRSYTSESEQGNTRTPISRNRSSSADGRQKLANKQNWFNYVEVGSEKKRIPASKGSLGIEYGHNSSGSGYSSIAKRHTDKKPDFGDGKKSKDASTEKKKVLFDEDNISLNSSVNKSTKRSSIEKMRHNFPAQEKLASILSSVKPDTSPATKSPLTNAHVDVLSSSSQVNEVPKGMEPFVVDIIKEEKLSLGISLVPAVGKCLGLFQVRFIFPGTAAANNGMVFCGDFIFSVNGVKLYNKSHPQAIHILKKCTIKCKLIVFREVKEKKLLEEEKKVKDQYELKADVLPGTISEKRPETSSTSLQKKVFQPTFPPDPKKIGHKEKVKPPSEAEETDEDISEHDNIDVSIPQCISTNKRTNLGPFLIEHYKETKGLGIDVMMDEFGQCSITHVSPTGSIANDIRIRVGDVVIAINNQLLSSKPISDVKAIIRSVPKGLVCLIIKEAEVETECSPSPKSTEKYSTPEKIKRNIDTISINSSAGSSEEEDEHSERLSTSSFLVLPPDNSEDLPLVPPLLFKEQPPTSDNVGFTTELYTTNFPDDMSDVVSLPPAPPRPSFLPKKSIDSSLPPAPPRPFVPQNVIDSLQNPYLSTIKDFDNISDVSSSLPPAPPLPVDPRTLVHLSTNTTNDGAVGDDSSDDDDSDIGSVYSCIPAPPPPLGNLKHGLHNDPRKKLMSGKKLGDIGNGFDAPSLKEEDDDILKNRIHIGKEKASQNGSGFYEEIQSNFQKANEREINGHSGMDDKDVTNTTTGYTDSNMMDNVEDDGHVSTPPVFDINQIIAAPTGEDYVHRGTPSSEDHFHIAESHESLSVYPEGIIVYNENNKKKSLFSKLRNKMVLPSKGNAKEYTSPSKDGKQNAKENTKHSNVKGSKQKQRPVSALEVVYNTPNQSPKVGKEKKKKKERPSSVDLSDKSNRSIIKASISQPDLTSMSSHEVDIMFKKRSSGPDSPVIRSIAEEWHLAQSKNDDELTEYNNNDSPPSSASQLPRILSFRKKSGEKRNRKRVTSVLSVSPPRTPPPPPPVEFLLHDKNEIGNASASQLDIGYPEKLLAGYDDEQYGVAKSMSESSSSIPASYAAFGPTITSANVSMDNLDTTYSVIGGKDELNVTYNVIGGKEQVGMTHDEINGKENLNSTYDMYRNDQVDTSKSYDGTYETIEEINSKLKPATKLKHAMTSYATGNQASSSTCDQGPQVDYSYLDPALRSTLMTGDKTYNGDDETSLHKKQNSELSEKDKLDPKLQPFIMSQGVSALLRTWPSEPSKFKTSSSPYSDYDDDGWGSEFSSNVLDYSSTPDSVNQARKYPLLNNLDNSTDVTCSLEDHPPNIENMFIGKIVPREPPPVKTKSRDFRNFFSRGNKSESNNAGASDKPFGKKEKAKLGNAAALPDKISLENMSARGGGMTGMNSQDKMNFDGGETLPKEIMDKDKESTTHKNPIAKPPRRSISHEPFSPNMNDTYYENLQNYNRSVDNETFEFAPPPPFPGSDEEIVETLSPQEHNKLYASIDYSTKINRRPVVEDLKDPLTSDDNATYASTNYNRYSGNLNSTYGDNGYTSDVTVYSEPERNNSPVCGRVDLTKVNGDGGYALINPIYQESGNGGNSSEIQDNVFTIQFIREPGKCIGLSLIGGSETPLVKNLIKSVDEESITTKCHVPLREGDEIIEINGTSVIGYTHNQVRQAIQESPPTIQFQIRRNADGNIDLLRQQQASENVMKRKIHSEKVIAGLTSETEILSLEQGVGRNESNENTPVLSSFESKGVQDNNVTNQLNKIFATRPPAPQQFVHVGGSLPPTGSKVYSIESESRSSTPVQNTVDPNVVTVIDIDLHKETGRGLGISVVGGPKHIINSGIKVKRLAPNSVAHIDGRLQKDDRIVAINGTRIKGMTQGEALDMLKNIKDIVVLTICRSLSQNDDDRNDGDTNQSGNGNFDHPATKDLKKSSSEACLPTIIRKESSGDTSGNNKERKSRSETKKNSRGRSYSETRELKRKPSTSSRSRSPGIFTRLFRGSNRSLQDVSKDKSLLRKNSKGENVDDMVRHTYPHTLYFDKASSSLDFKLTRGGKIHGNEPTIIVQSIRKGSLLAKSLFVGDIVLSINGISVQEFSDKDLKKFLRSLPSGAIPMVVQRS